MRADAAEASLCTEESEKRIVGAMARTKEFEREEVLDRAIDAFADHGFAGTSTETVLQAMGISRQSMYDTFGDKRRLYLEALERYNAHSIAQILASLQSAASPLAGIEAALVDFASRPSSVAALGCLGVSSVCEFGVSDAEVNAINQAASKRLAGALDRAVTEGQHSGEIDAGLKLRATTQFILAMFSGMKVAARGGATIATLRDMARMAIRSLKP